MLVLVWGARLRAFNRNSEIHTAGVGTGYWLLVYWFGAGLNRCPSFTRRASESGIGGSGRGELGQKAQQGAPKNAKKRPLEEE